jgi:PII-like signaling protein
VRIVWNKSLFVARIYPELGAEKRKPGFVGWFSAQPLITFLAEDAIEFGLLHVSVTQGRAAYIRDARRSTISSGLEMSTDILPLALEIVGSRELIERFLERHGDDLRDTLIVASEGVEVKALHADATSERQ